MIIRKGNYDKYYWIEIQSDNFVMEKFIKEFSKFLINLNLSIISFDGGSFIPTDDEYKRGWKYKNQIAYFDNINEEELDTNVFDVYDQWFLFDKPTEIIDSVNFVIYSGFTVDVNISDRNDVMKNDTENFWKTLNAFKVDKFILNGDNFSFGSSSNDEIIEIENFFS